MLKLMVYEETARYESVKVLSGNFCGRAEKPRKMSVGQQLISDFKLSPYFECRMFSSGLFPSVSALIFETGPSEYIEERYSKHTVPL
jgi:hypothetical protein